MMKFTGIWAALACIAFPLGSLVYLAISAIFGGAFGGLYRMFMYHEQHPFQYIALVSIVFGLLGSVWFSVFAHTSGWRRCLSIFATILLTILLSSVPGGMLWVIHDMQAGFFPEGKMFWDALSWGAKMGFQLGWLVVLISMPYNLMAFAISAFMLHHLPGCVARLETKTWSFKG